MTATGPEKDPLSERQIRMTRYVSPFVFLLSLILCGATINAQTSNNNPREDVQFWHESQLIMPVHKKIDLLLIGVYRHGRHLSHAVDERGGAAVAFKLNKYLLIQPTWLYVAQQPTATRKAFEHRLIFNVTLKYSQGKFNFTDRNHFERRVRHGRTDFTMYRNRLQIDHPVGPEKWNLRAYLADEVFHDNSLRAWSRNRAGGGDFKKFSPHFTGEIFYLRQTDGFARPGNAHAIGTLFKFYL
ncbi:MAG: DUF2490 domain-containing protein [Blastocatellia bacterium]